MNHKGHEGAQRKFFRANGSERRIAAYSAFLRVTSWPSWLYFRL